MLAQGVTRWLDLLADIARQPIQTAASDLYESKPQEILNLLAPSFVAGESDLLLDASSLMVLIEPDRFRRPNLPEGCHTVLDLWKLVCREGLLNQPIFYAARSWTNLPVGHGINVDDALRKLLLMTETPNHIFFMNHVISRAGDTTTVDDLHPFLDKVAQFSETECAVMQQVLTADRSVTSLDVLKSWN